jgi:hypothetical protein
MHSNEVKVNWKDDLVRLNQTGRKLAVAVLPIRRF